MILYDLFKTIDEDYCKCTVVVQTAESENIILKEGHLINIDNKAMYYIVDRIKPIYSFNKVPILIIYVIER